MGTKTPVVAAIPNYNMGHNLNRLLPEVLAQGYDAVYVLDDASTDDSADVVRQFGSDVKFVRSPRNQGAGATATRSSTASTTRHSSTSSTPTWNCVPTGYPTPREKCSHATNIAVSA